jgi:hypothetical protein
MLHDEADTVAAFAAAETLIDLFTGGNRKRRGFLIMKRAEAKVIGSSFLEFHKIAYHIKYIDAAKDLLYGGLRNHGLRAPKNRLSVVTGKI